MDILNLSRNEILCKSKLQFNHNENKCGYSNCKNKKVRNFLLSFLN